MNAKVYFVNLFVFFLIHSSYGQIEENKYRFFQNFENNNYISSEDKAFLKKGKIWNDTLFFSEEIIKNLSGNTTIPHGLENIMYQYLINNEYEDLLSDYDSLKLKQFIEDLKWGKEISYLGVLPIHKDYKTYLFLLETRLNKEQKDSVGNREVLALNVRQNRLLSIVRICSYSCMPGSCFLEYSIKKQNGYFDSVMTLTRSDVILMNKEDEIKAQEEMENNPWIIRFRINDQGFIELVEE